MKKCGKNFYKFELSYYHAGEVIRILEIMQGQLDDTPDDQEYWCYLNDIISDFANNKKFLDRYIGDMKNDIKR